MLKRLLIAIGLQAAPTPYGKYLAAVTMFGITPVAVYLAWKNRDQLTSLLRQASEEVKRPLPKISASRPNGHVGTTSF